jgi:hypothetical protein
MFAHEPDAVREVLLACQLICIPCAFHVLNLFVYTVTWPSAGHPSYSPYPLSSGCAFSEA